MPGFVPFLYICSSRHQTLSDLLNDQTRTIIAQAESTGDSVSSFKHMTQTAEYGSFRRDLGCREGTNLRQLRKTVAKCGL